MRTKIIFYSQINYLIYIYIHIYISLFELDGRKDFPINHGDTSQETLL